MTHLVQLADRTNNLIGYKHRDDLDDNDIWRISVIDIRDESDQYILVQKRSIHKKLGAGKWTIAVGGTLEKDDTYESCAIREAAEEIGVTLGSVEAFGSGLYRDSSLGYRQQTIYIARIPMDTLLTLQESEVEEVRWVSRSELQQWVWSNPEDFTRGTLAIWAQLWTITL